MKLLKLQQMLLHVQTSLNALQSGSNTIATAIEICCNLMLKSECCRYSSLLFDEYDASQIYPQTNKSRKRKGSRRMYKSKALLISGTLFGI